MIKTFREYITEKLLSSHVLYHGTHKKNLRSIMKNGIMTSKFHHNNKDVVFVSPQKDVAFGFAAMSGAHEFEGDVLPYEDRLVLKLEIPDYWYKEHFVDKTNSYAPEILFSNDIPPEFIVDYEIGR